MTRKDFYINDAGTENYILGYAVKGIVYGAKVKNNPETLKTVFVENDKERKIKYRPNSEQIAIIKANACEIFEVCTLESLEKLATACGGKGRKNRGNAFEELVAVLMTARQQEKQNFSYWNGGDIIDANGVQWQVKYNRATVVEYSTLERRGYAE